MATLVANELESILSAAGGVLRPADVVEFATNPETALHERFEWDDSEAAHEYRLAQARTIIRASVRYVAGRDGKPQRIAAYVSLREDRGDVSYRASVDVLSDAEMRQRLLTQALRELQALEQKYRELVELSEVFALVKSIAS